MPFSLRDGLDVPMSTSFFFFFVACWKVACGVCDLGPTWVCHLLIMPLMFLCLSCRFPTASLWLADLLLWLQWKPRHSTTGLSPRSSCTAFAFAPARIRSVMGIAATCVYLEFSTTRRQHVEPARSIAGSVRSARAGGVYIIHRGSPMRSIPKSYLLPSTRVRILDLMENPKTTSQFWFRRFFRPEHVRDG